MTAIDLTPTAFAFEGREVRTVIIDGEPHFMLNDVCAALGIENPRNVAARIDQDAVRKTDAIDSMGRTQTANAVSEPGLYEVIVRSNSPIAKPFKDWVFREVLPAIRKYGAYATPMTVERMIADPGTIIAILTSLETEREARAVADRRASELEGPAAQAQTNRLADGLRTIGDLANDLKVHCAANYPAIRVYQSDVFDLAGAAGLIIRGKTVRNNQPTARAIESAWVKPKTAVFDTNHGTESKTSTRLTPRGYGRLWDAAITNIREHGRVLAPKKEIHA